MLKEKIITAPPSKSVSHRVLMAAALAKGTSTVRHILESDDTLRTREVLSAVGAGFVRKAPGVFTVTGTGGKVVPRSGSADPCPIFVGESGTTCRLMTAILAAGQGRFFLSGAGRMHDRPMQEITQALAGLGVEFLFKEKAGFLPYVLTTTGLDLTRLADGLVRMGSDESSQYLSGLLLAAPLVAPRAVHAGGMTIALSGKKPVSWPYVGLTLDALERFGIVFRAEALRPDQGRGLTWQAVNWRSIRSIVPGQIRFVVDPGTYRAGEYSAEGDFSGASYFLAAGAIGPSAVRVEGLAADSLQGDAAIVDILTRMGARVQWYDGSVCVFPTTLRGITADMGDCPDLVPTVAALAAHAQGPTRIENVAHLRLKESDRLIAPALALRQVGCSVEVGDATITIVPPVAGLTRPKDRICSFDDHRIVMGMSLLGLAGLSGVGFDLTFDNPDCVGKSFPDFWQCWNQVRG